MTDTFFALYWRPQLFLYILLFHNPDGVTRLFFSCKHYSKRLKIAFQRPLIEIFFCGSMLPDPALPPPPPSARPLLRKKKGGLRRCNFSSRVPTPTKSYAAPLQAAICRYTEGGRFMNRGLTVLAY